MIIVGILSWRKKKTMEEGLRICPLGGGGGGRMFVGGRIFVEGG